MPDDSATIATEKDGPLVVTGAPRTTNSAGHDIRVGPAMRLCRCGASSAKPFCDNTHKQIGWRDEKLSDAVPDGPRTFEGKEITIHDNRGVCSHAGHCTDRLAKVFSFPEVQPDAATVDEIRRTIAMCPSGALSYTLAGKLHRDRDNAPEIHVSRNGPYEVRGGLRMLDAEPMGNASNEHYTLCRCGHSRNKPYCDGTHWYADFTDSETRTVLAKARPEKTDQTWHRAADLDEVPDGEVRTVDAGGRPIALARIGDQYHALSNECTHQGGPLGEGTVDGACIRCPWHGWAFDAATGANRTGGGAAVEAFKVEARDDGLYVAIDVPARAEPTVADVLAHTMVRWGVRDVFGMVGHSNLGMAEAVRQRVEAGQMRFIGVRHEGAAAFAASAYGKLTGRPAACLTIAGPGATNLLTGLWDAKVDGSPVLALTGQLKTQVLGTGVFQEIDLSAAFAAVSGFSQTVLADSDQGELMNLALKTAIVDGQVGHLILPDEVQAMPAPKTAVIGDAAGRVAASDVPPAASGLGDAMFRFWRCKRPVIIVGHGARGHMEPIVQLAAKLRCPILTTFKAKGVIPDDHPSAAGVLGRSGTPVASHFMAKSDLLVVFGASFSQHTGIESAKPTIQVDHRRIALGKFHRISSPVWGDIGLTAKAIGEQLPDGPFEDQLPELAQRRQAWDEEKARRRAITSDHGVHSASLFEALSDAVPPDAIMPVDVGNNTYSFGRYFRCRQQTILMSGYLGSIGFALPAAMGAWAGAEGRKVVSVGGDGGFGQYMGELTTLVKHNMDITHVLVNNGQLGKISKEQRSGRWPVWATDLHNPDFSEYARLCGAQGIRVDSADGLADALSAAISHEGPALVDVRADPMLV